MTNPRQLQHFINGHSVPGGDSRWGEVFNPASGQVTARVPLASAETTGNAVAAAAAALAEWSDTPPLRRARVLFKFRALLEQHLDELAAIVTYGNGVAVFTRSGNVAREFVRCIEVGMVGVNVPIPAPMAFHSFGGWKRSLFGDHAVHGPDGVHFHTRLKTATGRWPQDMASGASFVMPTH
ncbi:MAG: aldehyde dehydrogenase family protein [Candidatus Accumulibacter meliphilus]|jgi:acyl-CoA reductase-like NAD-dependent aldehyde dehydrogenase|uniref:Aldehyde dehydrogenase family protein n=1 Tax=Candidatus Accumulibacter meliphilus TaxID=2211374 RepID=A0A369XQ02_9PROT|nr:MAG: aldehyde dehydrogenase family protein [Candidatus Accumulibacter meliphilus]